MEGWKAVRTNVETIKQWDSKDVMGYDITLLTDRRYLHPQKKDPYIQNILLEDQLVEDALKAEGLKVNRVAWDDPHFDWSTTNYAVFRAVWDYFDRIDEFTKWYHRAAKHTCFINSKALIDWNIDKHYLKELQDKGIRIPKTLFVEAGTPTHLLESLQKAKEHLDIASDEFVLKPCVAGGARHTYRFRYTEWEKYDTIFQQLITKEAMMLQEFQRNVVTEGEVSLMVFNGTYTHAILKRAKPGDFRVQDDYGGTVDTYHPGQEEIAFAQGASQACPELPLYGRADIFRDNEGQWALAELEIFEPELWFRFYPEAATFMAREIKKTYFL